MWLTDNAGFVLGFLLVLLAVTVGTTKLVKARKAFLAQARTRTGGVGLSRSVPCTPRAYCEATITIDSEDSESTITADSDCKVLQDSDSELEFNYPPPFGSGQVANARPPPVTPRLSSDWSTERNISLALLRLREEDSR